MLYLCSPKRKERDKIRLSKKKKKKKKNQKSIDKTKKSCNFAVPFLGKVL